MKRRVTLTILALLASAAAVVAGGMRVQAGREEHQRAGAQLERGINLGVNKVRFYTPVQVGDRVRARAKVLSARRRAGAMLLTSETRIEVENERKPACVAETLGMYFFREELAAEAEAASAE